MEPYARYAVYYTPEPGPLAEAMAGWLGWDPARGRPCAPPVVAGLPAPVSEITATPRRYGFHATLKAPFRLASGSSPTELRADFDALAAALAPATLTGLRLDRLGGFLALVPDGEDGDGSAAVARIAAQTVAALDRHRAPAPPEEIARRRAAGLSPREAAHLVTWGYPYVMDAFRFHFTLTGRLDPPELDAVATALAPWLGPLLPRPFILGALSLVGEDAQGRFHILRRAPLGG